jgi:hypothetical protein
MERAWAVCPENNARRDTKASQAKTATVSLKDKEAGVVAAKRKLEDVKAKIASANEQVTAAEAAATRAGNEAEKDADVIQAKGVLYQWQQELKGETERFAEAEQAVQEAKRALERATAGPTNGPSLHNLVTGRRAAFADQHEFGDDDDDDDSDWTDDGGGGGGASDDEEDGVDDVFEPALQRVLISMLLKNRRLSAADCVRRICACDFSGCQLPCLAEQRLVRGFVGYPYYRDAVRHVVHRLYPLLQPQYR